MVRLRFGRDQQRSVIVIVLPGGALICIIGRRLRDRSRCQSHFFACGGAVGARADASSRPPA
jgi:hypothetical protein